MFRQSRISTQAKPVVKLVLLSLFFAGAALFVVPSGVSALSNLGPDPVDLGGRAGDRFAYTVASPSLAAGSATTAIPLYFPNNIGTKTVTITGGDLCTDDVETAPLSGGNDRDINFNPGANPNGAIATQFFVRNEATGTNYGSIFSNVSDSDSCFSDQLTVTIDAATALAFDTSVNMYVGYFNAVLSPGIVDAANRFSIAIESTAIVGISARNNSQSFGVSRTYPYSGVNEYRLPFAPDCTITAPRVVQAVLYDLDNSDPDMQNGIAVKTYVEEISSDGLSNRIPLYFTTGADPGSPRVAVTGDASGYTVPSGNGETVYIQFTVVPGRKYILGSTDVYYKNGLQFQLPFDSIYFQSNTCDPPTNLGCGVLTVNPKNPEINEPLTVTATFRFNSTVPTTITDPTISVRSDAGPLPPLATTFAQAGNTITIRSSSFVAVASGSYTVQWSIAVNGVRSTCGGAFAPNDSFMVVAHPLLRVTGGDVAAGTSFSTETNGVAVACQAAQHNPKAGVVGWNRGAPNYVGAGGQYATFAMSYIQNFVTNQGSGYGPASLSFANKNYRPDAINSVDPPQGWFGGLFGTAPCADYWGSRPDLAQLPTIGDMPALAGAQSGKYRFNGTRMTINRSVIPDNRRIAIYVEGDVSITGDIFYASDGNSWRTAGDIPTFKLIVRGRIYVSSNVSRLDGLYVAVPDNEYLTAQNSFADPLPGTISTCSRDFGVMSPMEVSNNDMVNICNRQLVVNGSFVANQIFFLRTNGTLSSNVPAEIFNYNPEMWLAPGDEDAYQPDYRSVIGLPPVL